MKSSAGGTSHLRRTPHWSPGIERVRVGLNQSRSRQHGPGLGTTCTEGSTAIGANRESGSRPEAAAVAGRLRDIAERRANASDAIIRRAQAQTSRLDDTAALFQALGGGPG